MKEEVFEREMKIAEIQGNIRQTRGINWVIISFALIILTIIIGLSAAALLGDKANKILNENSNTGGYPVQQK